MPMRAGAMKRGAMKTEDWTGTAPVLGRRGFLRLGLAGSISLGVLGQAALLGGCSRHPQAARGLQFLTPADVDLFTALLPVINGPAYPHTDAEVTHSALRRIDDFCHRLNPAGQAELRKLFDLLGTRLLRRIAAGFSDDWPLADSARIDAFLRRWRDSRLGLFNAGYRGLVKLCTAAFWSLPPSAIAAAYPGVPDWVRNGLEQGGAMPPSGAHPPAAAVTA